MRLIDADALEREIMAMSDDELCEDCCYNVVNAISAAPTEYRKSGYWIVCAGPDLYGQLICKCSNCHECEEFAVGVEVKFCWNCGTKMAGVKYEAD